MTDFLFGALAVVSGAVVLVEIRTWMRRRWSQHEQYPFLVTELGFSRAADRFLVDTRVIRYVGDRHGRVVQLEVGAGAEGVYVRLDFPFDRPVDLGIRVSVEEDDGLLSRVMRMREMQVGHAVFDSQFILLSRSEERLKEVLDDQIREQLAGLRATVRDLRLDEEGLHLLLTQAVADDALRGVVDGGARVTQLVFERSAMLAEERRRLEQEAERGGLDMGSGVTDTVVMTVDPEVLR